MADENALLTDGLRGLDDGLRDVQQKAEETARIKNQGNNYIPFLRLKDGEFAEVRFLNSTDEMRSLRQHNVKMISPKGNSYWKNKLCLKAHGTGQECPHCNNQNNASTYLYTWVWVYEIYHLNQNQKLNNDPSAEKWDKGQIHGETRFKQSIDGPMMFRLPAGAKGKRRRKLIQLEDEHGTLMDRIYKIRRDGTGTDTEYELIARDPSEMDEEIEIKMQSLPNVRDVAIGKVITFGNGESESQESEEPPIADLPF